MFSSFLGTFLNWLNRCSKKVKVSQFPGNLCADSIQSMEFSRPELVKQTFKERFWKHQNLAVHKSEGSQAVYQHITREKVKMITGRDKALPLEDLYPRLVCVYIYILTGDRGQQLQFLTWALSFREQFPSYYSLGRHLLEQSLCARYYAERSTARTDWTVHVLFRAYNLVGSVCKDKGKHT